MRSILKHFTSIIGETASSLEDLDDEVSELIISAEDSINKVKDMHTHISEKSDFKKNTLMGLTIMNMKQVQLI